jgi:hypothetical protein
MISPHENGRANLPVGHAAPQRVPALLVPMQFFAARECREHKIKELWFCVPLQPSSLIAASAGSIFRFPISDF